ncbi:unnamed protein product [Mytilus edulis]|uniref:Uncharacterized protein n=1 Tax=Mytilus edulis TaxID=6550 RepID=A0A8S3SCS4_MYTED|nr:unnamed protein product [Mytilus edulis]
MWRLYMDNEEDRLSLLVTGLNLRGRQVPLYSQNPRNPGRLQENTIRIKVKNVPLSADDGQIHRALTLQGEHKNDDNSEVDDNESADVNLQSNETRTKEQMSEITDKTFNASQPKPSQNSKGSSKHSDIRTGSTKNVQISNVSNSGNDKSQQSIDKFVRTPKNARRTAARNHTPPTPTDNIAPKKSKG